VRHKKNKKFLIQVPTEAYYAKKYLSEGSFLAMYEQINAIVNVTPKNILEIGLGNGNVSLLLKNFGYKVTTCDFDKSLKPDVVADICDLPFEDNSFDVILACEILEHIPFEKVPGALNELRRVSKKHVVISVPYACVSLGGLFKLRIPFLGRFFKFAFYLPYDWLRPRPYKFNGAHYWEMGRKKYPKKRIFKLLKEYFKIKKHYPELIQPEHYFFILEK
jgi:SAM-dependent methyltransferase